ncbi:MAG: hypothetical protein COV91_00700 [Candidatus Taylorbacteria bacterium CG11_big_fil_rev_8_21_14_0_20_46_11]|uniref:Uncharacterized protein n=1 Tax=Candidatus Taylorbacteria bacterium CG11_big_fil_rev_8_21_14_0_20_46_11 TaxID=1975025 RepID=A0A2H0KF96_9BACT|nr:MAG: hypothetical protein COV91_00700 [Candidatus Taylorbacteria bacterium CG11_big_fil_rev_8_21_14_0_20_46_11]
MFTTIIGLMVVGFFIWGFHKDGVFRELEHKRLGELTVNDFGSLIFGFMLIVVFLKLLFDLF